MIRAAVIAARLRGIAVRLHLRRPTGPGPGHPESLRDGLSPAAGHWLAPLDRHLCPGQASAARPRSSYSAGGDGK